MRSLYSILIQVMAEIKIYKYQKEFSLECGATLPELEIAYCTYGNLNAERDNVIWINHALTANSDPEVWWHGFFGKENLFDSDKYFIVCSNMLGSCYGTTGPDSINPKTGRRYGPDFPLITIRDMVHSNRVLKNYLGIQSIYLSLGGSMGGQQTLEWAIMEPDLFQHICLIACNAKHSPWGIAFNEAQRMALTADPSIYDNTPTAGSKGMAAARALGMISYRNYVTFGETQKDDRPILENHRAATYQRYQGEKLSNRFKPLSYISLSKSMDTQDVGRNRNSIQEALSIITAESLVIGIDTDILFPTTEQELMAEHIPDASFKTIYSTYGHDGFLLEYAKIGKAINTFLANSSAKRAGDNLRYLRV